MSVPDLTPAQPTRQLGNVIRHLRMQRGHRNQSAFARACGLGPQTLCYYEAERRQAGWPALYSIAAQLGVPVTRIVRNPEEVPAEVMADDPRVVA